MVLGEPPTEEPDALIGSGWAASSEPPNGEPRGGDPGEAARPVEPSADLFDPSETHDAESGYAILEPPPADARPFEPLPPSLESSPGVPPHRPGRAPIEAEPKKRRRGARFIWSLTKWVLGLALVGAIAIVAWSIVSFFIIRGGVNDANERIGAAALAALAEAPGSALTTPHTILFLGVDTGGERTATGRADSIVLMRTDPDSHQISLLSVPRDLRLEIPGHGLDKINAAYALGGTALMIETVENLTRTPIHHAALIDFDSFPEVIDAVGGVTIDVPAPIVSNRFDCPFPSQLRCESWDGWKFSPGMQTMDGKRALIYSRVRENRLDESESDITRGARQQAVIRATVDQLVSLRTFARLPFVGRDVTRPLTTDLTTSELFELALVGARAQDDRMVQCRLGGTPSRVDGVSYLVGTARNPVIVNMFLGRATPRKPQASGGRFAPGCPVTGAEPQAQNESG